MKRGPRACSPDGALASASRWMHPGRAHPMFAAGLLAVLLASPVHADTYDSALVDGIAARDRALETGSARDWRQALEHFARALALQPAKEAAFEYAEAAAALRLTAEAFGGYETALAGGVTGKAEARARAFLSEHGIEIGHLEVIGPAGAVLSVSGERRAALPLSRPVAVLAGKVQVRIEQPAHQPWHGYIEVQASRSSQLRVELVPIKVAALNASREAGSAAAWSGPALIGGGAAFVMGTGAAFVTTALLPSARRDLEDSCRLELEAGSCPGATTDDVEEAQAAADRIETLEAIRWMGVAGAAVGAVVAAFGAYELLSSDGDSRAKVELRASATDMQIRWATRF